MSAPRQAQPAGVRAVTFRNNAGETIPAYAAIHLSSAVRIFGQVVWIAEQWDGTGDNPIIYFNGPVAIPSGQNGQAFQPNTAQWVLYDTEDGTPTFQSEWGPVANSWKLGSDGSGFMIMGGATSGRVLAIAETTAGQVKEGILDGDLAASTDAGATEATATLSVWEGTGADWADSGTNITVTNRDDWWGAPTGTRLSVINVNGEWRPIPLTVFRLTKTDAALAKGASGTSSVHDGSTKGSETDNDDNITSFDRFADISANAWTIDLWLLNGYEKIAAECEVTTTTTEGTTTDGSTTPPPSSTSGTTTEATTTAGGSSTSGTTTEATTTGGDCPGECIYTWQEEWILSNDTCSNSGCECSPPGFSGTFFGQEEPGTCVSI